jgi:G3E family GTPase
MSELAPAARLANGMGMAAPDSTIPVTVLTGFLGAGKTTLLNYILGAEHGYKIAVIMNEFGEVGIDHELLQATSDQVYQLNNGCLCCTVRTDLLKAIRSLFDAGSFDYIVIETTGLADPSPIAQTFFNIPDIQKFVKLDAIVTVADLEQIGRHLDEHPVATDQISAADFLVLTKADLVSAKDRKEALARIKKLNPEAMVLDADRGKVDLALLLDADAFDLDRHLKRNPDFLDELAEHTHDSSVNSCAFTFDQSFDPPKLEAAINHLSETQRIFRSKGFVSLAGQDRRVILHGVNNRFTLYLDRPWQPDESRTTRLVFIGRNLNRKKIERALVNALLG